MMNIEVRSCFPQLVNDPHGTVYLDSAATTLKAKVVIDTVTKHYSSGAANVHRGAYNWSDEATTAFEASRENISRFVGARSAEEIIFTRGTTESINLVATSYGGNFFKKGDEILLTEMEHHSNIVPWQMIAKQTGALIKYIPVTDDGDLDLRNLDQLLTARTKMVSLVYLSNALGTVNPVDKIIRASRAVGAKIMLDVAQAIAALPIDVQALDCDFLAFSGHKMFGPTGVGVLYGKKDMLEQMPPYQGGGSMIANVFADHSDYLPAPQKFEAGTPAIAEVLGLSSAVDFINTIGFAAIASHERQLLLSAERFLDEIPGIVRLSRGEVRANVLAFNVRGAHPSDVGAILNQQNIAVRAGHHCCQPLMKRFGIPGTVRASFSIYNTINDAKALAFGVSKAVGMLI